MKDGVKTVGIAAHAIKIACSNCNLRELCMPVGLSPAELDRIEEVVASRRKIKRGSTLFRLGEKFTSLYAIRTGFFKTCVATEDGRDQVTGFQMAGEVIGLDGIVNDVHTCNAIALEDADTAFKAADTALAAGDLAGYQTQVDKAQTLIQKAITLDNQRNPSPSSSASPSAPGDPSASPSATP